MYGSTIGENYVIRRFKVNSKQLETSSVNQLKLTLIATSYLDPAINEGDKEPSWDGFVYVHDNKENKKKNIGKVPVQVKGSYQQNILLREIKYQAEVVDLRNYLADGGVIYFVVYVKSIRDFTIFYAQLEPVKLKEILGEKTEGHKTITLKRLPEEALDIVNIFKSFLYNRKKQMSFIDEDVYTIDTITEKHKKVHLGFTISGLGLTEESIQTFINHNNVYLYAQIPDYPIAIPLMGQLVSMTAIEEATHNISVNGEVFYHEQTRKRYSDSGIVILMFGSGFKLKIDVKKEEYTFNYNMCDNIRLLTKDLNFFILLYKNKGFEIDKQRVDMTNMIEKLDSFDLEANEQLLKKWEQIVKLLDYLNIKGDLDKSKLKKREWDDIDKLITGLLYKEEVFLRKNLDLITVLEIQGYFISLVFYPKIREDNIYTIEDLFRVNDSSLYLTNIEQDSKTKVPMFNILNAKQLSQSSNIRFDTLLNQYKQLEEEPNILSVANQFLLNLILAADLCRGDKIKVNYFLETSLEFVKWIQEKDKENEEIGYSISRLNELQIYKRQRALTTKEVEELIEISDSDKSEKLLRFGAYILLEDKIRSKKIFDQLKSDEQTDISGYPIYNLFENLLEK